MVDHIFPVSFFPPGGPLPASSDIKTHVTFSASLPPTWSLRSPSDVHFGKRIQPFQFLVEIHRLQPSPLCPVPSFPSLVLLEHDALNFILYFCIVHESPVSVFPPIDIFRMPYISAVFVFPNPITIDSFFFSTLSPLFFPCGLALLLTLPHFSFQIGNPQKIFNPPLSSPSSVSAARVC